MSRKLKKAAAAAAAVMTAAAGISNLYAAAGFDFSQAVTMTEKNSRNSLPSDAGVSYAMPKFNGLIGQHVTDFSDLSPMAAYEPIEEYNVFPGGAEVLPEYYDLRKEGLSAAVEDQNPYGTCWTFASSTSAATSLMKYDPSINLEEWHTAFYPYYGEDQIKAMDTLSSSIFDYGGTCFVVANLWSQWKGPVNSGVIPYGSMALCNDSVYAEKFADLSDYHLENAYMFDFKKDGSNRDEINTLIKQFLYNGQAVDVSFLNDGYSYNTNSSYTTSGPNKANHSVTIVGWDDNYTAYNFDGNTGAWIVKNSWGTHFGENGYFYISYDDASLCEFAVYELGEKTNYAANYHHDTFVPVQSMSADDNQEINKPSYMANVFTAESTQQIEAVATYINNPGTEYEVTVYTGIVDESDPSSGRASSVTKGKCGLTGYVTIELDEDVIVEKGEKFAVSVKMYCEDSKFVLPLETGMVLEDEQGSITNLGNLVTYEQICRFTGENESFYSEDGVSWTDVTSKNFEYTDEEKNELLEQLISENEDELTENAVKNLRELFEDKTLKVFMGNMSLKAFANPVNTIDFSHIEGNVPLDEKVSLSVKSGKDIYYSVNGGKYQTYDAPIEITEKMTIAATTDHKTYTQKTFVPAKAELSEIGYVTVSFTPSTVDAVYAERVDAETYNIYVAGIYDVIRFLPVSSADIFMDGYQLETGEYTEPLSLNYGENVFEINLEEENRLSNTVTVNVYREAVSFDLETEKVTLNTASSLVADDGNKFVSGESVSEYTGQTLTATVNGEKIPIKVPERAVLPELEIDYTNETLNIISNDIAEYVEYSVKTNPSDSDYISAEKRYIDGRNITSGMIMSKAFRVIPGETVTLRIAPGNMMFGSEAKEYVIPPANEAPEESPEYTSEDGIYYLEYSDTLEYGVIENIITEEEFEKAAADFGYDTSEYEKLMSERLGVSGHDELLKAMSITWDTYFEIEAGDEVPEIAVRYYADYDRLASKIKYEKLMDYLPGDVNGDGEVDASDASRVLAYYADVSTGRKPVVSKQFLIAGDYDGNGVIDSSDASLILKYYALKATGNL